MAPPLRRRTLAGYFDSARHEPYQLTWYHETEVAPPATFGLAIFRAVYINPRRRPSGTPPSERACDAVHRALDAIVRAPAVCDAATERLLMARGGLEGRPHATGGGWAAPGGITFYVARCLGGGGLSTGGYGSAWCEFLCADVDDFLDGAGAVPVAGTGECQKCV